jgi:tRNA G18 (ribose-2'-O)-methylase SpoU
MLSPIIILHDVRSSHNVGAVFRTADAAGVKKIYLSGYTPAPRDRFGRRNNRLAKTALGAETTVPWEVTPDIKGLIGVLKNDSVTVAAVEQSPTAAPFFSYRPPIKVAFLFGNEVTGLAPDLCALCDVVLELPMRGSKESLNVAVAVGVVVYHTVYERP